MSTGDTTDRNAATLSYLDAVARSARSQQQLFWFPMLLFGAASLVAAGLAAVAGYRSLALFWLPAGALCGLATMRFYRRREDSMGLQRPGRPYLGVVALLAVGVFGLPMVVTDDPGWATCAWVGVCYLGFAVIERSPAIAGSAVVLMTAALAIRLFELGNGSVWASALTGTTLILGGVAAHRRHVGL